VPEGVIFQSGSAYKALRKMLVETSLVAVVSLPAGVFNPYSGVKTSILILDKRLHKQLDRVLFVKIANDGFNLGAQRRAVDGSDLPEALKLLRTWMTAPQGFEGDGAIAQAVARSQIAENGDWNCSGDRYRLGASETSQFSQLPIGDLVTALTPPVKVQTSAYAEEGRFPIIDQSQQAVAGWTDDEAALVHSAKPLVIFGDHTCAVKLVNQPFAQGADGIKILQTSASLSPHFLYYFLKSNPLESDGYKRHFGELKRKTIPVPPLEVQRQIVAEIEGYQKVIDGARQVLTSYQALISTDPAWPVQALSELSNLSSGGTPSKANAAYWQGSIPWVSAKDMKVDRLTGAALHVSEAALNETAIRLAQPGSLLILVRGMGLANGVPICEIAMPCAFNQDIKAIEPIADVDSTFLRLSLQQQASQFERIMETAAHGTLKINTADLLKIQIALPPLSTQRTIVAEIEAEQALVNANRELIRRMEAKIKAVIDRVWGHAQ
jgi:type I restriction enzyme M protein